MKPYCLGMYILFYIGIPFLFYIETQPLIFCTFVSIGMYIISCFILEHNRFCTFVSIGPLFLLECISLLYTYCFILEHNLCFYWNVAFLYLFY